MEEARVRAAQLAAYAVVLEREAESGEGMSVAYALLSSSHDVNRDAAVVVGFNSMAELGALECGAARLRVGVDAALCVVSGDGILAYRTDSDNRKVR